MKIIYIINLVIIIINILIGVTNPILGLYFMIITGSVQIALYITYLFMWSKLSDKLKIPFIIYGIITSIILLSFLMIMNTTYLSDNIIVLSSSMITAGLLAFYFLFLSRKQYHFYKINNLLITEQ